MAHHSIWVRDLVKRYGKLTAVDELSFTVEAGEIVGLIGQNGAGKTSTLRCLAGIIRPTHGTVHVAGHNLQLDPIPAKRALAFVPDDPRFFDDLTVEEHLRFIARLYNVEDADERGAELLEQMQLADKGGDLADQLSRGMRQQLAVVCALLHRPEALLLDEPLSGLDAGARRRMKDTILAEASAGAAVILSSHRLRAVAEMCTRIMILREGKMVADGTMEEILVEHPELEGRRLEDVFLALTGDPEFDPDPQWKSSKLEAGAD